MITGEITGEDLKKSEQEGAQTIYGPISNFDGKNFRLDSIFFKELSTRYPKLTIKQIVF